ncbi:MAG: hypothetical protein DHS20C15_33600 [Planctomycetota bacterium]|nr:MAG: hypothetical protein DHS20C15_33600 [Planctomycetota bacterium]
MPEARRGGRAAGSLRALVGLCVGLASCAAPAVDTGLDPDRARALEPSPEVPTWVDAPLQRLDARWFLVGVGSGSDRAAAVLAARADALREFRRLQAFRVDATLLAAHRVLEDAPRSLLERLDDDALRAEAEAQLAAAEDDTPAYSINAAHGGQQAWQRVALDESALYPSEALSRLLRQPKMVDRSVRFVEEGLQLESAGLPNWSQLALLLAEVDPELPVDVLLRMARSHERRHAPLSAKRLLDRARALAGKLPEGDRERSSVQAYAQQLLGRVPKAADSVEQLARLSRENARPDLLRQDTAPVRSAPNATTFLNLEVGQLPARLLALWLEDGELVRLPLPESGRVRTLGRYHLGLSLSPDFTGAQLFAWVVPTDSSVWRAADALGDGVLDLRAEAKSDANEHARLALNTLVTRLADAAERDDVAAVVVTF